MLSRPWSLKEEVRMLVDPWTLFGRDGRVVTLFNPIISSSEIMSISGGVPAVAENFLSDLFLLAQESNDPVKIVINCPGGTVQGGFTIVQAMEHLKAKGIEVWTINMGLAASMAGLILSVGTKGRRYVFNRATTHAHEIQIKGMSGRSTDVEESQRHLKYMREEFENLLAVHTKIPEYFVKITDLEINKSKLVDPEFRKKLIKEFIKQERLMTGPEAQEAGIVDQVLMPGDPLLDEIFRILKRVE